MECRAEHSLLLSCNCNILSSAWKYSPIITAPSPAGIRTPVCVTQCFLSILLYILTAHNYTFSDPSTNEPLYECPASVLSRQSLGSEDSSDGSWGSSEFDEDENEEGYLAEPDTPAPTKPLPKKPHDKDSSQVGRQTTTVLDKKLKRLTHSLSTDCTIIYTVHTTCTKLMQQLLHTT